MNASHILTIHLAILNNLLSTIKRSHFIANGPKDVSRITLRINPASLGLLMPKSIGSPKFLISLLLIHLSNPRLTGTYQVLVLNLKFIGAFIHLNHL